jgi:hypothetical protein
MTAIPSLALVRDRISEGKIDEAVELSAQRATRDVRDHDVHVAWADALEELGLMDDVILELNLAIRDDPERLEVYRRLGEVFLDQGQPQRAVKVYSALVSKAPSAADHYIGLGEAYKDAKDFEKARETYKDAFEKTGDPRFKGLIRDLGFLDGDQGAPEERTPAVFPVAPTPHQLVTFTALFAGREGVHARQWVSPTGESGYNPVEEPFSPKVAENHILGNYTVGVYPVRLDNTVNFVAFDFDASKFAVRNAISNSRAWDALMGKTRQAACRLLDAAARHDIPMRLEDSGFKGYHAWVFLETPVPAGVAKKFGETLAAQILPLPNEITVEVFPKQGSVRRGGVGSLIKLPLGVHRRTGKRALFIEPNGEPVEDQLGMLDAVVKASRGSVYGLIQRVQGRGFTVVSGPQPAEDVPEPGPEPEWEPEPQSRRAPLVDTYDLDRDPQFQYLIAKCATLRAVIESVNRTSTLSSEETQVIIHTLGHLERGPDAVNELFRRCINADPALFLKSKLRGNPMSCPKIRARVPGITSKVACNCVFDLSVNLYPTPLIHVSAMSAKSAVSPLGLTVDSMRFQNLVQEYLQLRRRFRETRLLLDRYEKELTSFFEEAGVNSVETPTGKLSIVKKEGGEVSFTLDM